MFTEQELREIREMLAEKRYELQCQIDDNKGEDLVSVVEKDFERVDRLMNKCTELINNL